MLCNVNVMSVCRHVRSERSKSLASNNFLKNNSPGSQHSFPFNFKSHYWKLGHGIILSIISDLLRRINHAIDRINQSTASSTFTYKLICIIINIDQRSLHQQPAFLTGYSKRRLRLKSSLDIYIVSMYLYTNRSKRSLN